jgi:hypothetical protein
LLYWQKSGINHQDADIVFHGRFIQYLNDLSVSGTAASQP